MLPSLKSIEKKILEKSLLEYVQWSFFKKVKRDFIINYHHKLICDVLERVANGEILNLVINIAPRYSKTEIAVKAFIEWSIAKNPESRFIHLSYSDMLALDNSSEIREDIKSDWFQEYWPVEVKRDSDAKQKWYTKNGGGVYATGTMGSITGFGAGSVYDDDFQGCIIIDDPTKPDEIYSEQIRKRANERLNNTILSRRNNPKKTPIIIIMQRLHEDDMSGFCLGGGTGEHWHHLSLPAINEMGEPLWPQKHSLEHLDRMRKADRKMFAGQYMQAPAPEEGTIIKRQWFKTYETLPYHVDKFLISADFTFKGGENADFVVIQAWAKCGGEFYLLDQVRGKMDFPTTKTAFSLFCKKHPKCTRKLIEAKANGQAIIDSLKKEISGIIPISPKDSKEARANAVSSLFEAGNVYFPKTDWIGDLIEEAAVFPEGKHDDQVDAMTQALIDMSGARIGSFTEEMLNPMMNVNLISKGQW